MEQTDHEALSNYEIDEDYIDVEENRADISVDEKRVDQHERNPQVREPRRDVDMTHTFGRHDGSGSGSAIDDEIDTREATERDDRGGETGMDVSDAESYYGKRIIRDGKIRTRAEWLLLLNNGYRDGGRRGDNQRADNQRWIGTICSQLDLTDYQQERVTEIIDSVNMRHFGSYKVEVIVLAAISLVAQVDGRMVREERAFKKFVKNYDENMRSIKRVRELLRQKSDQLGE